MPYFHLQQQLAALPASRGSFPPPQSPSPSDSPPPLSTPLRPVSAPLSELRLMHAALPPLRPEPIQYVPPAHPAPAPPLPMTELRAQYEALTQLPHLTRHQPVEYMCEYTYIFSYLSMLISLPNHCYAMAGLFTNMSQLSIDVEM